MTGKTKTMLWALATVATLGLIHAFRCSHADYSMPWKADPKDVPEARFTGYYVVCLECGHRMPYNWQEMRFVRRSEMQEHDRLHRTETGIYEEQTC